MNDKQAPTPRQQRTASLRRRATGASLGALVGAFILVGVTAPLSGGGAAGTPPETANPVIGSGAGQARTLAPVAAPRRIRTRQS